MNMNTTKQIRLHDHHYDGMSPAPRQLPASSVDLISSPFHQGLFMTSAPHQLYHHHQQQQQHGGAEEYYAAGPRCVVGSSTAAFYAAENLLGMAQLDLPGSLGMVPPAMMMPASVAETPPSRSSEESELYRPIEPPMLRAADQSSSVRTYYVRPQRRDAAELELQMPPPQQQQQQQQQSVHHGLFGSASGIQPHSFSLHVAAMEAPSSLQSQLMENHLSRPSCGGAPATASHSGTAPTPSSSKTRIRWTQDLHELFVERVKQLGGADRATPKGILKLMDSDVLTIYHIKSHLQKYRTAKCTPPPSSPSEGRQHEKMGDMPNLDQKTGTHITEALRVQLDVQRRLHEQLEIQRRLQVRIEEQGKRLQKMFEDQLKASGNNYVPGGSPEPDAGAVDVFPAKTERDDDVFVIHDDDEDDDVQLMPVASSSSSYDEFA